MSETAKGEFDVRLAPQTLHHADEDALLGRMSIDKTFTGDLVAGSTGEMLSARTLTETSAGYVAIEKVVGKLHDQQGSFVLQHSSTMHDGLATQSITVVPDSGTGALEGLRGEMQIIIEEGKHFYEFIYQL